MNATDGLSSVKGTEVVYTLVLFLLSAYTNVVTIHFVRNISFPKMRGSVCKLVRQLMLSGIERE